MSELQNITDKLKEELDTLTRKVMPKDVTDAKERFESQIEKTTELIRRVGVYGSYELEQKAYDTITEQLKSLDSFLEGLYNESIGEN